MSGSIERGRAPGGLAADEFAAALVLHENTDEAVRLRKTLQIGVVGWVAFGILDWIVTRWVQGGDLVYYVALRSLGVVPILIVSRYLHRRTTFSPRLLVAAYCVSLTPCTFLIALMSLEYGGIASPYAAGICAVLVCGGVTLATHWRRASIAMGVPALAYPVVMIGAALLTDEVAAQFRDPRAVALFVQNLSFIAAITIFVVMGSHTVWTLRREAFEARNLQAYLQAEVERQTESARRKASDLEDALDRLSVAHDELRGAQVQLVQSEKMASLGVLVAGVAHEINNPVTFIVNNIPPLEEAVREARMLADGASPELTGRLDEIREIVEVVAHGAARTAGIVADLRAFSRVGDAMTDLLDVHDVLDVTLRLLRPRWADRCTVHTDYADMPSVQASPGQLSQVFMNVLANACDAVSEGGNIWIGTSARDGHVEIRIRDDGCGIPAEVLGRVFDPFFTTKPRGRGVGLGLAITHGIVARHGGEIRVRSSGGAGTEVTIELPVRQSPT